MSVATTVRWRDDRLTAVDGCETTPTSVLAADSWLVQDGAALAIDLHRNRFGSAVASAVTPAESDLLRPDAFWDAAIASIPRSGAWFPRVELVRVLETPELRFRLRPAPELRRSITLATHDGADPRTAPSIKGPDLEALLRLRTEAQGRGADDAVILDPDGVIVDGTTTAIAWWHGDALAIPSPELPRVDSVTLRSVLALATALGVDVLHERATPDDLDGHEVWALNALHGIRIVTGWAGDPAGSRRGAPAVAEEPGRLESWRRRLHALRRPLPGGDPPA